MSKRKYTVLSLLGLLSGLGLYQARRRIFARLLNLPAARHKVSVKRNIPIQMEDGVVLMTDHYAPKSRGTFPTILIRTPYGRGLEIGLLGIVSSSLYARFAERGYHVIVQTTRGQFDSQGEFEPFLNETSDGLATIKWIREQAWFNGYIGMWGASYLGMVQWAIATQAPPELKAIMPIVTPSSHYELAYPDGAFGLEIVLRWMLIVREINELPNRPIWKSLQRFNPAKLERVLAPVFNTLPLADADVKITGQKIAFYQNNLHNPDPADPFWEKTNYPKRISDVLASTHLMTGWFDFTLRQTLREYAAIQASGPTPYLTIGPWHHFDSRYLLDALREGIDWFEARLKGNHYLLRRKPVRIFVMGANEWREMEAWPPPYEDTLFYLQPQGLLAREPAGEGEAPSHYRYNPADPTPVLGGPRFSFDAGAMDNRALEARPDVLTFTTAPLLRDLEVIGPVRLNLYVRSSLDYTDFFGKLCDVFPDGRSINVCDGIFRIKPGRGEVNPDGSLRITINIWATAYLFQKGHRIRLQVSSGAHPRWMRNLGTGEPIATATRLVPADQTIYHDFDHPSALLLPVG